MTVGELIAKLQEYPADVLVVRAARESGYNEVDYAQGIRLKLRGHPTHHYGKYDAVDQGEVLAVQLA